ncbi:MAG TPA: hypothetical protein VGX78_21350 [Pirellulales bacterium]|jgi:hypothetical protein|nr:hypothetical protein [Pirellulales bacterium]
MWVWPICTGFRGSKDLPLTVLRRSARDAARPTPAAAELGLRWAFRRPRQVNEHGQAQAKRRGTKAGAGHCRFYHLTASLEPAGSPFVPAALAVR